MTQIDDEEKSEFVALLAGIDALGALVQKLMWKRWGMNGNGAQPERVLFCSPVTGKVQPGDNVWGGGWFITTKYLDYYSPNGVPAYHPGVDLNLPNYADSGKDIYAAADGEIVVAGVVSGWPGQMVVIKHLLEDGTPIWTRYAHLKGVTPIGMVRVFAKRGEVIGQIGDYAPAGPVNDHLDYSVCRDDLGSRPGDWPGLDKARIIAQYIDPTKWHADRRV